MRNIRQFECLLYANYHCVGKSFLLSMRTGQLAWFRNALRHATSPFVVVAKLVFGYLPENCDKSSNECRNVRWPEMETFVQWLKRWQLHQFQLKFFHFLLTKSSSVLLKLWARIDGILDWSTQFWLHRGCSNASFIVYVEAFASRLLSFLNKLEHSSINKQTQSDSIFKLFMDIFTWMRKENKKRKEKVLWSQ